MIPWPAFYVVGPTALATVAAFFVARRERHDVALGQEPPDPKASEAGNIQPASEQQPLVKQAAVGNEYAGEDEEQIARALHDRSVFAQPPNGVPWEKVDPVMRERRLLQAHDLKVLGYMQAVSLYYGYEAPLEGEPD